MQKPILPLLIVSLSIIYHPNVYATYYDEYNVNDYKEYRVKGYNIQPPELAQVWIRQCGNANARCVGNYDPGYAERGSFNEPSILKEHR